jgi:glycosyltransferase involved in cell wall biosynthesis
MHIITSLGSGGAQTMLYQLLKTWGRDDNQHMVISLLENGPFAAEIQALGFEVLELGMRPGRLNAGVLLKLIRVMRAYRPDLIQTWLYHADLIGGILASLSKRTSLVWGIHHTLSKNHGLKPATLIVVRINALLSWFLPARIICCSVTALETHARFGYRKDRMLMIPNGIDTYHFQPDASARIELRRELQIPDQARIIGMYARFHPQKDHRNLILAAGILHREIPSAHFVLAGEGMDSTNSQIKQWIAAEEMRDHIHPLGPRRDMPLLHAALDIFTLSSSGGEAFPLVLGEAMACGVPCVATDVGDAAEIIGDTGYHVPARHPRALAQAWQLLLELPSTEYIRLSRMARERVHNKYNLLDVSKTYRDLYNGLSSY